MRRGALLAPLLVVLLGACAPGAAATEHTEQPTTLAEALPHALEHGLYERIELSIRRSICCFVDCPSYTLTLRGDGSVVYEGWDHVEEAGTRHAAVDPATVRRVIDEVAASGFATRSRITDVAFGPSSVTLKVSAHGIERSMLTYAGAADGERPEDDAYRAWMLELASRLDALAGTERWIHGDPDER